MKKGGKTKRTKLQKDVIKKDFPKILAECLGIVGAACEKADIARSTYYEWRNEDPQFAKACDATEIVTHSMVRDKLLKKIMKDDTTAIIFYCKTKMKSEGFVERYETTGKDGGPVETKLEFRSNDTDKRILEEFKEAAIIEAQNNIVAGPND